MGIIALVKIRNNSYIEKVKQKEKEINKNNLTNKGWKSVSDIYDRCEEYKLASYDINSKEIFYDDILNKYKLRYIGNMIHIAGSDTDQLVTPDHDVVIGNKKLKAIKCLGNKIRISDISNCGYRKNCRLNISDDMIRLIVNVVCDATIVHESKYHPNSKKVRIKFKLSKDRKINNICSILDRLFIKYTVKLAKKYGINKLQPYYIRIYGDFARMIDTLLESKKQLPEYFRFMDYEQCIVLLHELSITDGVNVYKNLDRFSLVWSSVDEHDIKLVQEICVLNNISTYCVYSHYTSGFKHENGIFIFRAVQNKIRNSFVKSEEVFYDDFVFCFSVAHGTLISRRNNKVAFTGNCNHDWIDNLDVSEWHGGKVHRISDSIIHLMRGQVFEIEGKKFFTMGGAESIDKIYRIEGVSWWRREIPCYEEEQEGLDNLRNHNHKVDYILTHTCPKSIIPKMFKVIPMNDTITNYLDYIKSIVEYDKWYFGHWHQDKEYRNFRCLYNEVIEL